MVRYSMTYKIIRHISIGIISISISTYGVEYFNGDIISIFVSILSIFSGLLIALIALINKELIPNDSGENKAHVYAKFLMNDLFKLKILFYSFLSSIFLLLVSEIFKIAFPLLSMFLKYIYIFIGIASLLFSFSLPEMILKLQKQSIDSALDNKKEEQQNKNEENIH